MFCDIGRVICFFEFVGLFLREGEINVRFWGVLVGIGVEGILVNAIGIDVLLKWVRFIVIIVLGSCGVFELRVSSFVEC